MTEFQSPFLELLKNRINLTHIPFSERGSRLLIFRSHQHLSVRLAERWFKVDQKLSGYRQRPPIIDEWQFTDGDGQALDLEITSYPHQLEIRTRIGTFTLIFHDIETFLLTLPPGACGINLLANVDKAQHDRRGGILGVTGDIRRNIAYTTNARVTLNSIEPIGAEANRVSSRFDSASGGALLLNITPRLGFNRYMPDPEEAINAAAKRWHDWFAAVPAVEPEYQTQYYFAWWIMRAGLISTRFYLTREAMTPSKIHYVGVWQWDAYFHALAYRHIDKKLAHDQLRIMIDHQRADGMIPDAVHDEGTVTRLTFPIEADVTKPPLLAWAAWKLYEVDHDREFLDEIYEPIVRWNNWWFEQNDTDGDGLCEYQHPYSSGLDDSPLWDNGMPVESPDLNTYLFLQLEALAKIASVLDLKDDAEGWAVKAEEMAARITAGMWDEASGYFWANRIVNKEHRRVNVRTPFNLFPLLTGRLPKAVNDRLIAHLTNEHEFWSRYPVPSVALDDPKFDALTMWRGPTWVNVNYMLIEGLQRNGYIELARELRRRTLEMIKQHDDIYEYYQSETGEVPPKAASIFGWSSAVFIDLAIQVAQEKNESK